MNAPCKHGVRRGAARLYSDTVGHSVPLDCSLCLDELRDAVGALERIVAMFNREPRKSTTSYGRTGTTRPVDVPLCPHGDLLSRGMACSACWYEAGLQRNG